MPTKTQKIASIKQRFSYECSRVKCANAHPTRPWLIFALHSGQILIWCSRTQKIIRKYDYHKGPVRGVFFHRKMPLFVSGGDDFNIVVWNYKEDKMSCELKGHVDYIRSVEFHSDLPWVLSSSDDQTVRLWNYQSRMCVAVLAGHSHYVMSAVFHPTLDLILSSSLDSNCRLWSFEAFRKSGKVQLNSTFIDVQCVKVMSGHQRGCNWACFHPQNNFMCSASDDKTIRLWKYSGGVVWHTTTLTGHTHNVCYVLFEPKSDVLLSGSQDKTLRIWNYRESQELACFNLDKDRFWCITLIEQQKGLIVAGHDSGFKILQAAKNKHIFAIGRNGSLICNYGEDNKQIFQFEGAERKKIASGHNYANLIFYSQKQNVLAAHFVNLGIIMQDQKILVKQAWFQFACFVQGKTLLLQGNKLKLVVGAQQSNKIEIELGPIHPKKIFSLMERTVFLVCDKKRLLELDWTATLKGKLVIKREIEVPSSLKQIITSKSGEYCLFRFKKEIWVLSTEMRLIAKITSQDAIVSAIWDQQDIFFYSTISELRYGFLNGSTFLYSCLDKPKYLVCRKAGVIWHYQPYSNPPLKELEAKGSEQVNLKHAVERGDWHRLNSLLKDYHALGNGFNAYLHKKKLGKLAAEFIQKPKQKLEMCIACGNLDTAFQICQELKDIKAWSQLAKAALIAGNFPLQEASLIELKDLQALSFLYLLQGNQPKLKKMLAKAQKAQDLTSRFNNALFCGDSVERIKVLTQTGNHALAYVLASSSGQAELVREIRGKVDTGLLDPWKGEKLEGLKIVETVDGAWPVSSELEAIDTIMELVRSKS